ncbi:kinase-like domain-containing protein [Rhizophagus diaphanus]|nr:kinase-like domain-containing protein [Rhizophagus diaphanus] [Rhizophagus sp. MUCL 43196]
MKSLFSLVNPIKKTKNIHNEKANEIKTYPIKSIQDNKKKITNRYQEMTKNDKKLIAKPEGTPVIKPMELRLKYGSCLSCYRVLNVGDWCKVCETRKFEQNFKNWTSGYPKIDQLIRESQLNAIDGLDYFEWIDYEEFMDVEYITEGAFGKIFKGKWTRGPKHQLHSVSRDWTNVPDTTVALKEIKSINWKNIPSKSENASLEMSEDEKEFNQFLNEKRQKSNSYIMVMKRLEILEELSGALDIIHSKDMVHKDLHCGNILMDEEDKFQFPAISDLGLCGVSSKTSEIPKGVFSFIAPEHLNGSSKFTTASDIYSFGIIMWVICCCELPYKEYKHDPLALIMNVLEGYRPEISKDIPKSYADLMKRCWDDDSKKRPKASELRNLFLEWKKHYHSNNSEILIAENVRLNRIKNPDLFDDVFGNQVYKKSKNQSINSYAGFENASPSNIFEEFEKIDFGKVEI